MNELDADVRALDDQTNFIEGKLTNLIYLWEMLKTHDLLGTLCKVWIQAFALKMEVMEFLLSCM